MMLSFYLWTLIIIGRPQDIFPDLLFHLHPGKIAALLTIGLYGLNIKKRVNEDLFKSPEVLIFLLFGLLMVASGLFGVYPRQSLEFLKQDFLKLAIYFLILSRIIITPDDIRKLAWVIVLAAVMISLASLRLKAQGERISVGTMYDPNDLAMVLVISFPFLLHFFLEGGRVQKAALAGAGAIVLSAFLLTKSRGGFLGLVAVILAFAATGSSGEPDGGKKWSKRVVILLLTLALAGLATSQYWQRIRTIFSRQDRGSMREVIWKRGLVLFAEHPWLGVGVDCFSTAYGRALEQGKFYHLGNVYDRAWKAAHNSFLQVGAEMGIFGFLIFLFLIGLSCWNFQQAKYLARVASAPDIQQLAEMFSLGLIGFLVCGFFLSQAYSVFPYLFLAVSGLLRRQAASCQVASCQVESGQKDGRSQKDGIR
ncbi:MAG: O-antigen ligase family protein [bacterium]|nr:O-antigen ligase family protein [bacterium]